MYRNTNSHTFRCQNLKISQIIALINQTFFYAANILRRNLKNRFGRDVKR
jgi:hypothetical protein